MIRYDKHFVSREGPVLITRIDILTGLVEIVNIAQVRRNNMGYSEEEPKFEKGDG